MKLIQQKINKLLFYIQIEYLIKIYTFKNNSLKPLNKKINILEA